jgi:hypothetical protein
MASVGDHDDVAHSLIPLALAVGLLRHRLSVERAAGRPEGDLDALAGFSAAMVPLYEYDPNPSKPPRRLARQEVEGGLFRDGARELRFLDGRPAKRHLAVNALDLECVSSVLADPESAARIRSRYYRLRAQKLRARAAALRRETQRLRRELADLRGAFERGSNRV